MYQECWWGNKVTFLDLFMQFEPVLEYNRSPEGELVVQIGETEYGLEATPASIRLYDGMYCMVFELDKLSCLTLG